MSFLNRTHSLSIAPGEIFLRCLLKHSVISCRLGRTHFLYLHADMQKMEMCYREDFEGGKKLADPHRFKGEMFRWLDRKGPWWENN